MSQTINPIETARLAAGILNVQNLTEENKTLANSILLAALKQLDVASTHASLADKGIII